ncbi:MAG: bifunctional UDP-3-O-[3-hydroxymyristoyl] N-acetylglucosamine deacetylase/3-hydroxyacyl-ACP dehydratase [candidate division Zixibacteria bacterium]|nr:bifunctional UDP-3-O-[3-hydroxymyristoyl] N-acetylglucosamine deacetylase/3-hydroxyacyl-ACP dehydratase [candidate division Zixibacteria bacterium]NIR67747.1 bifunctional UDP-3-O-[3-hydroxymyristoyl] N-acetylglucosamine deacetylase/3-hydroxyacyl-ACP dehydratase [candidate division Zixibacteria bacterium]NIS16889.1 bifunctional UDP-3-O-[3-hydroxymyristoyl] N-acetylglucosamine deacetylase/3-hydroxyacyl-ACP dehydratase [candidate division Zixibacteria bacterium]NIS49002.1 bifunctional UDP-3-O-[3
MSKQKTIAKTVSLSGVGLHTGCESTIRFVPAGVNEGISFTRTDVEGCPKIPALLENVVDLNRGTTLGIGDHRIHTVEHVLSSLAGLEIDNVVCELDNIEPPIVDGSMKPFVDKLLEAGIVEQEAEKNYLVIDRPISYSEPDRHIDIVVTPSETIRITFLIDYKNPALGTQYTSLVNLEEEFVEEFAPARTFCFLSEVEALREQEIIKGGGLDSALVIVDRELDDPHKAKLKKLFDIKEDLFIGETGILNNIKMRFYNEPVRHKAADLLGDLMLIGMPIKGHILAARSGHAANVALAKKIREQYEKTLLSKKYTGKAAQGRDFMFDSVAVMNIMPHRYPFLLVDRIIDLEPGKRVIAQKNVTINEPFFEGHFPGHPIMPGVLLIEALAQAGGFLLLHTLEEPEKKLVYFMSIDNARFRRPVVPGDVLRMELEMVALRRNTCKISGKTYVDGQVVTEATFMSVIVDK